MAEVNGVAVDKLAMHRRHAPMNQLVIELALEIEAGRLEPGLHNAAKLIAAHKALTAK